MNYYDARERLDGEGRPTGRFDMTQMRDKQIWSIGYCEGWKEITLEEAKDQVKRLYGVPKSWEPYAGTLPPEEELKMQIATGYLKDILDAQLLRRPYQPKYHTDGHATQAEAFTCYRGYLLDQKLELEGMKTTAWFECEAEGCDEITNQLAEIKPGLIDHHYLCDKHRNREVFEKLFIYDGPSYSSY